MTASLTEVNSLEVSEILDVPRILKLAVVAGLDSRYEPKRSLAETAEYLKEIGLEKRVLPTGSISFIEQQAFAKLRRNPKIKEMYQILFGLKPQPQSRVTIQRPRSRVCSDRPSALSARFVQGMDTRRCQAKARKDAS
jgi:hypothetical protein